MPIDVKIKDIGKLLRLLINFIRNSAKPVSLKPLSTRVATHRAMIGGILGGLLSMVLFIVLESDWEHYSGRKVAPITRYFACFIGGGLGAGFMCRLSIILATRQKSIKHYLLIIFAFVGGGLILPSIQISSMVAFPLSGISIVREAVFNCTVVVVGYAFLGGIGAVGVVTASDFRCMSNLKQCIRGSFWPAVSGVAGYAFSFFAAIVFWNMSLSNICYHPDGIDVWYNIESDFIWKRGISLFLCAFLYTFVILYGLYLKTIPPGGFFRLFEEPIHASRSKM